MYIELINDNAGQKIRVLGSNGCIKFEETIVCVVGLTLECVLCVYF